MRRLREALEFVRRKNSADALDASLAAPRRARSGARQCGLLDGSDHHLGDSDFGFARHGHRHHDRRGQLESGDARRIDDQGDARLGRRVRPHGDGIVADDDADVREVGRRASGRSACWRASTSAWRRSWSGGFNKRAPSEDPNAMDRCAGCRSRSSVRSNRWPGGRRRFGNRRSTIRTSSGSK